MSRDVLRLDRTDEVIPRTVFPATASDPPNVAGDVTQVLVQAAQGNPQATEQLLPLVYDELRRLAARRLAAERPGQTMSPTALVHEAYLRLVDVQQAPQWDNRNHFFVAAAEAMRRILVENARRKRCVRHGGDFQRQEVELELLPLPQEDEEILAIDAALARLSVERPEVGQLVKLRYFAGLSVEESAALLDISPRTAQRYWAYARARLFHELSCTPPHAPPDDS